MNNLEQCLENGKQRGASKNSIQDGISYWADAAIQKHELKYKVHISLIEENNMISEEYVKYFTRSFTTFEDALNCIENESVFTSKELLPIKGQLLFNPEYNEENT